MTIQAIDAFIEKQQIDKSDDRWRINLPALGESLPGLMGNIQSAPGARADMPCLFRYTWRATSHESASSRVVATHGRRTEL